MMSDVWARRRGLLQDALSRSLESIEFSHGRLVREQVEAANPEAYETAALACLAAAEAAGGSAEAALPAAVSMAMLSQMALVFTGLENAGGTASLSTAWGVPRSLNAGDAMFALAQESVLAVTEELTAVERLQATNILDRGGRELVDALFVSGEQQDRSEVCQRALLPSALGLGGLLGGANATARERLMQRGREWSSLPSEELSVRLTGDTRGWLAT